MTGYMIKMSENYLEIELFYKQKALDEIDTFDLPYKKAREIQKEQDEAYKKWKLLNGIMKAKNKGKGIKNGKDKRLN